MSHVAAGSCPAVGGGASQGRGTGAWGAPGRGRPEVAGAASVVRQGQRLLGAGGAEGRVWLGVGSLGQATAVCWKCVVRAGCTPGEWVGGEVRPGGLSFPSHFRCGCRALGTGQWGGWGLGSCGPTATARLLPPVLEVPGQARPALSLVSLTRVTSLRAAPVCRHCLVRPQSVGPCPPGGPLHAAGRRSLTRGVPVTPVPGHSGSCWPELPVGVVRPVHSRRWLCRDTGPEVSRLARWGRAPPPARPLQSGVSEWAQCRDRGWGRRRGCSGPPGVTASVVPPGLPERVG